MDKGWLEGRMGQDMYLDDPKFSGLGRWILLGLGRTEAERQGIGKACAHWARDSWDILIEISRSWWLIWGNSRQQDSCFGVERAGSHIHSSACLGQASQCSEWNKGYNRNPGSVPLHWAKQMTSSKRGINRVWPAPLEDRWRTSGWIYWLRL